MPLKEVKVRVEDKYVKWFSEVGKEDVKEVGGKAANLGEMLKLGLPVPPGFVINALGYLYFLEETGLKEEIYKKLKEIDVEDTALLEKVAKEIREMFIKQELPDDLREEILEAYGVLGIDKDTLKTVSENVMSILKMQEPEFVAVRSSATAEDSSVASFAGQQETFLNVKGNTELIEAVKKCFASLFTARSIYYRVKKKFKHEQVLNAVIVERMVNSDKSGVIFSREPVTKKDNVIIEAVFGLGEGVVSGKIKPDSYLVSKEIEILKKDIFKKKIALVRNSSGQIEEVKLTESRSEQQVLTDYEIKRLASYAIKLENHYNIPQDIEFAIDSGEIFIVQTRPITTLEKEVKEEFVEGKELLSGLAASPGIGSGHVKIIKNLSELGKIKKGDVLVTKMTNPDMVVTMQKSSAIVTDEGGITAHAAIVSREMGIPAVVGTGNATTTLKDGLLVTVDGFNGKIYEGTVEELKAEKVIIQPIVETQTKIKVMVDLPSFAERASKTQCKEVGLVRLEGIIAESGKHPYGFLKENKINEYEKIIFSGLQEIGKYFDELWIRTSDIRSDEYMSLKGAPKEKEANPMLGMHGIRDSLKNKEILKAELKAISDVKKKTGILLPQLISVQEVKEVKKIIDELNLDIILGVMIETPASVEIINELCNYVKFVSFGTNDLTQYTLAVDRGNEDVQYIYDEMHPAVLSQIERVIRVCKSKGVETSICGQAGSRKEMVDFLVKLGIDSISVNADKAKEISEYVKELEDKGLRGSKLKEEEIKKQEKEDLEKETEKKIKEIREERERKLYPIICDSCNREAEVPFKPKQGRPVYCRECYLKKKNKKYKKSEEEQEKEKEIEEAEKKKEEEEQEEETEKEENVEKKEEWQDVDFGIDIFSQQENEKLSEEEKHKAIEQEKKEVLEEERVEEKEQEEKEIKEEPEQEDMIISVDRRQPEELEEEQEKEQRQKEALEKLEEINKEIEEKVEKASEDIKGAEEILDIF